MKTMIHDGNEQSEFLVMRKIETFSDFRKNSEMM